MERSERVYGSVSADVLHRIDADATEKGISRTKWLNNAIALYLDQDGAENRTDMVQKDMELQHLKELISVKDGEIQHLRYLTNDLRQLTTNLAAKVPALPAPTTQEPTQTQAKTPLWKKVKNTFHFWTA